MVLAFGVMLGVSALRTEQQRPAAAAERQQLVDQIHARENHLNAVHRQLSGLETSVAGLQKRANSPSLAREHQTAVAIAPLAALAGTAEVSGPGLQIVANNAPNAVGTADGGVILDTDLQDLVNALWTAGAEAITINGHRLTSLSAIRFAGRAITVDYRSLTPPYVIDALGNPDTLPARLLETPGGQAWLGLKANFGITFETKTKGDLLLPGDLSPLREAHPVGAR